jgi:hypothetical protein
LDLSSESVPKRTSGNAFAPRKMGGGEVNSARLNECR